MKKIWLPLCFVAAMFLAMMTPAAAQSCQNATIVDLTGTLNQNGICEAAKPLKDAGYTVFVYYTTESFDYIVDQSGGVRSDGWYARLDQVERENGMYNLPTLFALEVAAAPLRTVTINNTASPLEARWTEIKSVLEFRLDSDPTLAFTEALNKAASILAASAPAAPVAPVQVQPTKTMAPTKVPQPTATPRPAFLTTQAGRNFLAGIAKVFGGLVLLAVLFCIYWFPVRKFIARQRRMAELRKQLGILKQVLFDLKDRCEGLLGGDTVEDTAIYRLWFVNGGPQQKEDVQVRIDIERGRQAFRIVMEQLGEKLVAIPRDEESLEQLITDLEEVYLLFVGTSRRVLDMNSREIEAEFNPLLVTGDRDLDDPLVRQARDMMQKWSGGALRIELMFADPRRVDQKGILGSVSEVKQLLFDLVQAHDQAPSQVDSAKNRRREVGDQTKPPFGITAKQMFSPVDRSIAKADASLANQQWSEAVETAGQVMLALETVPQVAARLTEGYAALEALVVPDQPDVPSRVKLVKPIRAVYDDGCRLLAAGEYAKATDRAESVKASCARVVQLVPDYLKALASAGQRRQRITNLQGQGFNAAVGDALQEVGGDVKTVRQALTEGSYEKADEYIREILGDSSRALQIMETLVSVHGKNLSELRRLSTEVARVQSIADGDAKSSWSVLQTYPAANWKDVDGYFVHAVRVLRELFDDPANADDLASRIQALNESKKQSSVTKAEAELVQAFHDLHDAETELKQIIEQGQRVHQIEQSIAKTQSDTVEALTFAQTFIREHKREVDQPTEELLDQAGVAIAQATKQQAAREFVPSQAGFATAREMIVRAISHAKEEVAEIVRLYDQVVDIRESSENTVRGVQTDLANMTPAARKASTSATVDEAATYLHQAKTAETQCADLEDHALAESLANVLALYQQAQKTARDAAQRMDDDLDEYLGYVRDVETSINSASLAIATASKYVSDSDANSAGSSALQRAQSSLPDSLREGETVDALRRKRQAAESAASYAAQAQQEAQNHIRRVEAAREAERQQKLAEERARQAAIRRAEEAREAARRHTEMMNNAVRHTDYSSPVRHTTMSNPMRNTTISSPNRH